MNQRATGAATLALLLALAACSSAGVDDDVSPIAESVPGSASVPLPAESIVPDDTADDAADEVGGGASTSPLSESEPGESAPGEPGSTSDSAGIEPDGVQPAGYTTAMVEITKADGTTCEECMWLADSAAERGQGLMGVTDLGDAAGMAFVFERPTSGAFFMFQTVTPLSIAWFATDGSLVSTADMAPCASDDRAACERFPPGGDYQLAIEVFQGDLESVGITPGAQARIIPGTEATSCRG